MAAAALGRRVYPGLVLCIRVHLTPTLLGLLAETGYGPSLELRVAE